MTAFLRRLIRSFLDSDDAHDFDHAAPFGTPNEPHHAYEKHLTFRPGPDNNRATDIPVGECCAKCGGGRLHEVHSPPFEVDPAVNTHLFVPGAEGVCEKCGGLKYSPVHTRAAAIASLQKFMGLGQG